MKLVSPVYLIGSLRNPDVPKLASALRVGGFEIFDDWYSSGPEADDYWQAHEKLKGHSFLEALAGYHAQDVFHFDKTHLDRCNSAIMLCPAGRSCHLELGYMRGQGKYGAVILDPTVDRWDIMYQFANEIYDSVPSFLMNFDG